MKNGDTLPQDIGAEKGLPSSILLAPERVMSEHAHLRPEDFFHPAHKEIFTQLRVMREEGKPIDLVTLTGWLDDRGLLDRLGGAVYVTDLFTVVPTASNAKYYAEIVEEKAYARGIVKLGEQLASIARDAAEGKTLPAKVRALVSIIESCPKGRTLPPMISADKLCSNPPPTPPEIIEGILHQGSKMALGGGSKSFKTWTLLELSICIATGRDWLGFPTTKGRVLYVNLELPAFAIEKRIREICEAMSVMIPSNLVTWNLRGHAADSETILPMIAREAKNGEFALIILDPLYKLLGEREENATHHIAAVMNAVERLAVDTGAGVAFGSHFAKGNASQKESMDRISGSGVFARDPDTIITMTAHEEANAFTVDMTLRNFPPQEPFVVRRQHPLMGVDGHLDPAKLKQPGGRKEEVSADDVLGLLGGDARMVQESRGESPNLCRHIQAETPGSQEKRPCSRFGSRGRKVC
jgi:hypothetical protein